MGKDKKKKKMNLVEESEGRSEELQLGLEDSASDLDDGEFL